jgi:uncharacterized repeat protein (TIGR01451 family)
MRFYSLIAVLLAQVNCYAQEFTVRSFPLPEYSNGRSMYVDGGEVWVATNHGAYKFNGGGWELLSDGLHGDSVLQISKDVNQNMWFLTDKGVSIRKQNSWKYFDNYSGVVYHKMIKNIEGEMWMSYLFDDFPYAFGGNLKRMTASDTVIYNKDNGFGDYFWCKDVGKKSTGEYLSANESSLASFNGSTWSVTPSLGKTEKIYIDKANTIYLAGEFENSKVMINKHGESDFADLLIPSFEGAKINAITGNDDDLVYFATDEGLAIFEISKNAWTTIDHKQGIPEGRVLDVEMDENKNVWILTQNGPEYNPSDFILSVILFQEIFDPLLIHGKIFHDINNDGKQDSDEPGLANHFVKTDPQGILSITNPNGEFFLRPATGQNTLMWVRKRFWEPGSTPVSYTFTYPIGSQEKFEIGLKHQIVSDAIVTLSGTAVRPGFNTYYSLSVMNEGSVTMNPTVTFDYDPTLTFLESDIAPTSHQNQRLSWNIVNIDPLKRKHISLKFNVNTSTPLGDTIKSLIRVNALANEIDIDDNEELMSQVVTGSFDPNDKLVAEGIQPQRYVVRGTDLTYTIRFQNTGTDTAFTVKIKDQLDPKFEIVSLEVLSFSHTMNYILDGRTLIFYFNDIKLPDSTRNERASHGYVKYRIGAINTIPNESIVRNSAAIYFDFNEPVVTNEVVNTYVYQLPVDEITGMPGEVLEMLNVYPNPANDFLYFDVNDNAVIEKGRLISMLGEQVIEFDLGDRGISLTDVPAGLYILRLYSSGKVTTKTVLVLHK